MPVLSPMLVAGLTGLISGLLLSVPVGPVNLTIMNEGARRGFKWAMLIGLGATVMEAIYCFTAFTGFAAFFQKGYVQEAMELFSFLFIVFLGMRFLMAKSVSVSSIHLGEAASRLEARVGTHFKPGSAFMTGFVQVMGNLGVLVWWIILAASFMSHGWVQADWPGKITCVAGVVVGMCLWFASLSWLVSLGHGKFSEKTLLRMQHFSGVCLLVIGVLHGGTIIWQMHQKYEHENGQKRTGGRDALKSLPGSIAPPQAGLAPRKSDGQSPANLRPQTSPASP